jgi:hypothetical protein
MAETNPSDGMNTRLERLEAGQTSLITAIGLMLDTMQQMNNLLVEIAEAVREEPGESPVVKSLDELTGAVVKMGANVETLAIKFDELPGAIADALEGSGPDDAQVPGSEAA